MSAIKEAPLSEAEVKELQRLKNDPDYADLIAMLEEEEEYVEAEE